MNLKQRRQSKIKVISKVYKEQCIIILGSLIITRMSRISPLQKNICLEIRLRCIVWKVGC